MLGVAEMFSLDLILIMLAVGALAGMVLASSARRVGVQVLVARHVGRDAGAGPARRWSKRLHSGPELRLGHGKLVGQQGVVTETITAHQPGRIKLAGEIWIGRAVRRALTIEAGETVEVLEIRGATAYVHPVPRLEP